MSIELWSPGKNTSAPAVPPNTDRWVINVKLPLRGLIGEAYGVSNNQVVGRDWSNDPIYQITVDGPPSALAQGDRAALRDLLAKHFGLVVKTEATQMDGYVLEAGPAGSKLTPASGGPRREIHFLPDGIDMINAPVSALRHYLQHNLNAPVVDQTDLEGGYDYKFTRPEDWADPTVVGKALRDQFGLELRANTVTADVIRVIAVKSPEDVETPRTVSFRRRTHRPRAHLADGRSGSRRALEVSGS